MGVRPADLTLSQIAERLIDAGERQLLEGTAPEDCRWVSGAAEYLRTLLGPIVIDDPESDDYEEPPAPPRTAVRPVRDDVNGDWEECEGTTNGRYGACVRYTGRAWAKAETERGLLVVVGSAEAQWFPRSQIAEESEVQADGDRGELIVSRWIAEQKGLV